jgi:hypothetical protein
MASGLQTLHGIDSAIRKARSAVSEAAKLPQRANEAVANLQRQQALTYEQIAASRLDLIETGESGGSLGYVDRQAAKLLEQHADEEARAQQKTTAQAAVIESLEDARRAQEKAVAKAVDAYDKAVATTEMRLIKEPDYMALTDNVERLENITERAEDKLNLARQDEKEKGTYFLNDPFFTYLQNRKFGTKQAKGWGLTKWLDKWVAGKINYRDQAVTYRRLTDIPKRLAHHAAQLETDVLHAQDALHIYEAKALEDDGVKAKQDSSTSAQAKLDKIDSDIETAERDYQALLKVQLALNSGDSGPYREAIDVITATLKRKDLPSLKRIAAQTRGREDDEAVKTLRELSRNLRGLEDDREDAKRLLAKYQHSLKDLEKVRRRFKNNRYDAPSSVFGQDELIGAMLGQVLSGLLTGDDFWRQLKRAQRTLKRYSDQDFGGIDWEGGFRLPRSSGGGWGRGSQQRSPRRPSRRRTSLPRRPPRSLPRSSNRGGGFGGNRSGGRSGGRFKTGGGF